MFFCRSVQERFDLTLVVFPCVVTESSGDIYSGSSITDSNGNTFGDVNGNYVDSTGSPFLTPSSQSTAPWDRSYLWVNASGMTQTLWRWKQIQLLW